MTKRFAVAVMAVSMLSAVAAGAQQPPADPHGHDANPAATVPATLPARGQSSAIGGAGSVDEHVARMRALHDRMMRTSTPEERQKLAVEMHKEMEAGMTMMGPMMGAPAAAPMSPAPGERGDAARLGNLEQRMDMMQMMMQLMVDEQGMAARGMRGGGRPK